MPEPITPATMSPPMKLETLGYDQGGRMVDQVDPQIDGPYGRIKSGRRHVRR